ncbi:MAG TPA: amino acid adenylation domain-containing protein [Longimicrobium sp.]|nr:amino acid adenylation domain-containing protein [Longimicrobium sp.]
MSMQDTGARRAALSDNKRALLEARLRGAPPVAAAPREGVTRCAGEGPEFPASFAQERMWFLNRFAPESPMYNIPAAFLVPADVDVPALERALSGVIRRHEALRTTYRMGDDGQLLQVVQPDAPVAVEVIDVRDRVGEPFARHVHELVGEEGARLFDLERGPMIRVTLLRVSDREHAMVITTHHIATDGWSFPLLMRDLLALYEGFREGREAVLPELPLRYADYAVWQRNHLQGENLAKQVAYWRQLLDGVPALDLPTDRPRPAVASNQGRSHAFRLDAEITRRVRDACRAQAATLNMVVLAAFAETLRRYSGQDDLVIGTLLGSRSRPELEPIVGMFVNSAALRLRLPADATFRDAVAAAKRAVLDANQHQDLPFEKLVDELGVPRDLSRHPLFQVLYFHNASVNTDDGASADAAPALPLRPVDPDNVAEMVDAGVAKFDLQFATVDTGDELSGGFEYATDLFDAATIVGLERVFRAVLDAALRNPDAPLASLDVVLDDERRLLLQQWGTGPSAAVPAEPVHRRVVAQAAATPDAVAIVAGGERLTYAQLDAWANRIAGELRARGAGLGGIVGVYVDRDLSMVPALLGILKTGAAYLPLDPVYPPERIAYMLQDSGAALLLADPALPEIPAAAATLVAVPPRPDASQPPPAVLGEVGEVYEPGGGELGASASAAVGPHDRAYLIYTSGSTGRPKAVEIEHGTLSSMLASVAHEPGMRADDVTLAVTTISFDVSVPELFLPLVTGARVVIASREEVVDGVALGRMIDAHGVTVMQATPATWRLLVQTGWTGTPRLRAIATGEALTAELAEQLIARVGELWNLYGPTEITVWATGQRVTEPGAGLVDIGGPMANVRAYVLDARGRPVPAGVPGELFIGGGGVARGYLNRPELTAEKFVADPFAGAADARMYRTGDRVRWRADGTLAFMGRLDGQVKLRGYRIELGEIESELLRHPSVSAAAAVLREDVPGDPRLVGYFVAKEGAEVSAADLRAHLRERLPEYMVPTAFVALDEMPLTGSGKTDRRALPAPEGSEEPAEEFVAPRNVVEDMVAEIWAEVLRRERVGVTQNFFELGGHSLLATQVIVRITDTFEVEIPIRVFFQDPTIGGLASAVEAADSPVLAAMVDELAGLSAEEIEALLAEESA